MQCPCNSNNSFNECCEVIHKDLSKATTAEKLMRARYSAFSVKNIDFIYNTFHPTTRRFQSKKSIEDWANETKWFQLEIIKSSANIVEFKAHYLDINMENHIHHEKSNFKKGSDNNWYYVDGVLRD